MQTLNIDFETRSAVDLRQTGVYPYAADPTTDVWCMAYAEDGEEPALWVPGDPVPGSVLEAAETGAEWRAWNAQFERLIYNRIMVPRYGFPELPMEAFVCTMMEASAMALPRALFKTAQVLKVAAQKDSAGHRLMMQMAKPRTPRKDWPDENPDDPHGLYWWDDDVRKNRLYKYCLQDVRTEAAVANKVRRLSETERKLYLLDQQANDRGVYLDVPLVEAAMVLRDEAIERANRRLIELTDHACSAVTNTASLRKWLGVDSIAKDAMEAMLAEETDPVRREVIQLRADVGRSSVAKLDTMMTVLHTDGALHGLLQFLGADTGRWAGRLVQPQNFPRPPKGFDPEALIPLVRARDYDGLAEAAGMHPMEALSYLLRSMLIPRPGWIFRCADYSAIEGWVVSWLAGQDTMTSYEEMAARIYGVPVESIAKDSDERAVGKEVVLGGGFGMGWKKFQDRIFKSTGIELADNQAQLVINTYRETNWQIKDLWYELERAALEAVAYPGKRVRAGRGGAITYRVKGPYLWAILPSGRPLCYPLPQIVDSMTPWGEVKQAVEISTTNSYTRKWGRRVLYGGLQTENVVQAIARDVMAEAMLRIDEEGTHRVVLTVHDEILSEAQTGSLDDFCELMGVTPEWAPGLQVNVEGWEGERYRK